MNNEQQRIVDMISAEISIALHSYEHSRHESGGDIDKIEAHMNSYLKRVDKLRIIRGQLEDEFTILHYDPR